LCSPLALHLVPANLTTRYYDFHGVFRLVVHSADARAINHFASEYGVFEAQPFESADLEVMVGPFSCQLPASATAFGPFWIADGWVYARERYKVATWRFALSAPSARTVRLLFDGGAFSLDFLQPHFVEPLLRYKACQKGYVLVGGGSVVRADRRSVLFSGLGHTGKTALALRQVLGGWGFQADDLTLLSATGQTFSYPRRLHISDHMFAVCPSAMKNVPLASKLSIKGKMLIYNASLRYGELQESLRIDQLVPDAKIDEVARLGAVLVLTASMDSHFNEPRPLSRPELIARLMAINGLEGRAFTDLLWACHSGGLAISPADWWQMERQILDKALVNVPGFELAVPRNTTDRRAVLEHTGRILDQLHLAAGQMYGWDGTPSEPEWQPRGVPAP
jgi:hypothetical protein